MTLKRLELSHVRNLRPFSFEPDARFNVLFGNNGSGKTSVLEAIHLLGLGRTFRSGRIRRLINDDFSECWVSATTLKDHRLGIRKQSNGGTELRIDGSSDVVIADLVRQLPLQLLNPEIMNLLDGGSKERRSLLDWGVFHVEHQFFNQWQRYQRALKQRNSALKNGTIGRLDISPWHHELSDSAAILHALRLEYMGSWQPYLEACFKVFLPSCNLSIEYAPGWDTDESLFALLEASWQADQQRGHTQIGPHRADLKIKVDGVAADEVLSRGQKKMVVCAIKLSQVERLKQQSLDCVLLVDDLASELDSQARLRLCEYLATLETQVFITCIDPDTVEPVLGNASYKMFHVEHGVVTERLPSGN